MLEIDTGEVFLQITFDTGSGLITKDFPRETLTRRNVDELAKYGIVFDTVNPKNLLDYLQYCEAKAPISKCHKQLGWSKIGDQTVFRGTELIKPPSVKEESKYVGGIDTSPSGTMKAWLTMFKSQVLNSPQLLMVTMFALASPVLGILNETHDLGCMLLSLSNISSTGKTTAAMLAASTFSNPKMNAGLCITYNATTNALVKYASMASGHPLILDEAVITTASDITKQLYTLCAGRDKLRCDKESELKEVLTFSSMIISTAEFPLVDEKSTSGIKARVYEIDQNMTNSAEHADAIKNSVLQNYGHVGPKLVKFILDKKLSSIETDYKTAQAEITEKIGTAEGLIPRVISKIAIVLLTAHYFSEAFKIDIDFTMFVEYICRIIRQVERISNCGETLIDILLQEMLLRLNKFIIPSMFDHDLWGGIEGFYNVVDDDTFEFGILTTVADELFRRNEIGNYKQVLKQLKAEGILIGEADRLSKRMVLNKNSGRQKCYVFRIKGDTAIMNKVKDHANPEKTTEVSYAEFESVIE